ncbi:SH3 domain-containing protein [Leptolyngbya ohadii]|uniref:SH3 domain-containing protein n=1 Tax=Leptolyngbya ohadii TaxID=1962290 RepID=UPI000B598ED6|nr:SH3 domain-containing protein [Leptolyngbya ohadii]
MKFRAFPVLVTTLALSLATALSALAQTATIQGNRVNVRRYPSTSAEIQSYASAGDRVEIVQSTNAPDGALWYMVMFPNTGVRGWVRSDLVRLGGQPPSSSTERISFAPGTSGATVGGRVQGTQSKNYLLGASAGQTITTAITGTSPHLQVRVIAPNGVDIYVGSANWSGVLPISGDYQLQVRMVPEMQQSGASGEYSLTVAVR